MLQFEGKINGGFLNRPALAFSQAEIQQKSS